jgi:hypothetical protein
MLNKNIAHPAVCVDVEALSLETVDRIVTHDIADRG